MAMHNHVCRVGELAGNSEASIADGSRRRPALWLPSLGLLVVLAAAGHCQLGVKRRGSAHDSFWRAGLTCVEAAARRGTSGAFLLFSDLFHAKLTMPCLGIA